MTSSASFTTIVAIVVTVAAYAVALQVRRFWRSPLANPVLIATTIVVAFLTLSHVSYARYAPAKFVMTALLGPATVALALPLYRNRAVVAANLAPAAIGLTLGSLCAMLACDLIARALALGPTLVASLSLKSATAPIAVEIAKIVHGDPAITAVLVVTTGITGSIVGPGLMDRIGIRSPLARGLALGTISHGIGTAQAATESEFAGAVGGVAMGAGAIFTATIAPLVIPLFQR